MTRPVKRPMIDRPAAGTDGAPALLVPDEPFPPYRFVPGHAPHPFAHEGGWGYGSERPVPPFLPAEQWRENRAYLRGVDFFNRGWWWEAHEAWEELWHVVEGRDVRQHDLLKGLIQLAACALNRERGSDSGADRLLRTGCAALERAAGDDGARFCGLDLAEVVARARELLAQPLERVDGFYLLPR